MIVFLLITLGVHLSYWVFIFTRLIIHKDETCVNDCETDLVVCVKNEEEKIDAFFDRISGDEFSKIIVVDDFSSDGSSEKLKKYIGIEMVLPDKNRLGKKEAVIKGIKRSTAEYIAFTDIDCEPAERWIPTMLSVACDKDLVLGYSPMKKAKGWIPFFSRYETYHTALQYLSYAASGLTYMGVGRNMLVKRLKGIEAIPVLERSAVASGDDDLLVNHIARKENVAISINPSSFVPTEPKANWDSFIRQKSRHISTASSYRWWHQILLALYSGSFILFYLGIIILPIFGFLSLKQAFLLLLLKWSVQQLINYPIMKRLEENDLWPYFPVLDVFMFIYLVVLSPYIFMKNSNHWN